MAIYFELLVFTIEIDGRVIGFGRIAAVFQILRHSAADENSAAATAATATGATGQIQSVEWKRRRHTPGFSPGVEIVSTADSH